jgi:hypothetical protein
MKNNIIIVRSGGIAEAVGLILMERRPTLLLGIETI